MRILIIEDEKRLAETLRQLMEEQHYQADVVFDGADGLDYGLAGEYDLILLDIMLPKLGGFQVARRLRAERVSTPILMLTARAVNTGQKLPALYLTCGLSDYLYEDNRRLRRQLDFLHIPYVYEEWAGAHEWDFWDRSVRQFLQFIRE